MVNSLVVEEVDKMSAPKKVQVQFLNSNFTNEENKRIETVSILALASDFMKASKADHITRISKVSIPIFLSKTKTGRYIAFNPSSDNELKVPIMQLPPIDELTKFCEEIENLDIEKLHTKLLDFKQEEALLRGGIDSKQMAAIEIYLKAPRETRADFKVLSPIGDMDELKEQLNIINQMVYDEKSLDKAIKDRIKIVETALKEKYTELQNYYKERETHWKNEIQNADQILKTRLSERDKKLANDIKKLDADTDAKINNNMKSFVTSFAKNIRKDEKDIERLLQELEKLSQQKPKKELVETIKTKLSDLREYSDIFHSGVVYAIRQADEVKIKESDIIEIAELNKEGLINQAEIDKKELIEKSKRVKKDRDEELKSIKKEIGNIKSKLDQFNSVKEKWINEIKNALGSKGTDMLPVSALKMDVPPTSLQLLIPMYLIQFSKKDDTITRAVPPVRLPNSMKKPDKDVFAGPNKTVFFIPVVPNKDNFVVSWIEKNANKLDILNQLSSLPNIINNPKDLREIFFTSQKLMVETLKVDKKKWKKLNENLTALFSE